MIVLLRRKHLFAALCAVLLMAAMWMYLFTPESVETIAPEDAPDQVVILDAGHGGADGGAVSPSGVVESGINLAITEKTADLLVLFGQNVVLTRTGEEGLYNEDSQTIRQKKVADTRNRVALINETEGAVLISIHQNSIPTAPRTHGAQVFYNTCSGAKALAQAVQRQLNTGINPGNEKTETSIPKSVYIMSHVTCPAILVECGFLSNSGDTALLQTQAHQMQLALAIVSGYLSYKG